MLRQLIKDGLIAAGDVDERSIADVLPSDVQGYTQCHFFAGIGGWSVALRLAGWPNDKPVWTGSCPCQPFSTAGKQKGKDDIRHLWPEWFRLISQCQPATIFGEQVAGAIAYGWWDDAAANMESQNYACGAAVLPACSIGTLHRRERLWFTAIHPNANSVRSQRECKPSTRSWSLQQLERLVQNELWVSVPTGRSGGLVDGFQCRTSLLHGFGNAIVPQVAATFIKACGLIK